MTFDPKIEERVLRELERAQQLFPPFNSAHEGWAVIAEEFNKELWEVICEKQSTPGRMERMEKEAIQVTAMALRFLIDMKEFKN